MLTDFYVYLCKKHYQKILKRIQKNIKKKPIKVVFLVAENSKWGYQSLYEEFESNKHFEPVIVVSYLKNTHKGKDKTRINLEENYNFFKSRGMNVEYGYKNHKYIDLKVFKPDMVFYEQPWELPKLYKPFKVSRFALTFLSPYSFQIFDYKSDYMQKFHKFLFKYFVTSEINIQRFESYKKGNSSNCINVNYVKLDTYLDNKNIDVGKIWKDSSKIKIIYAPHHSFEANGINAATFKDNGKFILEFAQSHPETTWIFKPHPRFKYALEANNIMSAVDIENYYKAWEKIGKIYEQGDYFDIFRSSDLMITDCCSFLGEYLPTGKPLIRPIKTGSVPLNKLGVEITKGYYETSNNNELKNTLISLFDEKNDYKKNIRNNILHTKLIINEKSSKTIIKYLLNILERE